MAATNVADIGTYVVTTTTTIPQINTSTGLNWSITTSFTITVLSDCTTTTLTTRTVNAMTYGVTLAATSQNIFYADAVSTAHSNPTYCGPRTYTLTPSKTWWSVASDTLTVQTSTLSDVGVYPMSLTTCLANWGSIPCITTTFTITITCTVTSLAFTVVPPILPMTNDVEVGITT
jgi:hypothetical protein